MINAMKSAIGTAIKTPYNPKIQERIKINGINNKHCLNDYSYFFTWPWSINN